jgi:hypothetical protein
VLVGAAAVAALGAFVALLATGPGLHVIGRGHLVPYTEHEVLRVRAFDSYTFLAAPQSASDHDVINGLLLALLAGVALLGAMLAWTSGASARLVRFFSLAALGAAVLGFAEIAEIDETVGYNVQWIDNLPGVTAENLDLLVLGPVALVFLWLYRDVILSSRDAVWFWAVGAVLFFLTLGMDLLLDTPLEDAIEVVASTFLLVGYTVLAVDRLRAEAVEAIPAVARKRRAA